MKILHATELFLEDLKRQNRSKRTIESYYYDLKKLCTWSDSEKIGDIKDLDLISSYAIYIYQKRVKGKALSIGSQCRILATARSFCHFLYEKDYLAENYASFIRLPKQEKRLPRGILSVAEVDKLLSLPKENTIGLRNQAILELLYGTGIRASELCSLHIQDLDLNRSELIVLGKGGDERLLPIHNRLKGALEDYLDQSRPLLLKKGKRLSGTLFLNNYGHGLKRRQVAAIVKRYTKELGKEEVITSHHLRHTVATHLLQNGADIRFIGEFLGHRSIESTRIYTRVSIGDLKSVVERFHPLGKDMY